MYNIVVLWFCGFVVLLFSDFVECISNAINKTTRQQNNQTTLTYSYLLIFYSYLLIFYSYLLIFYSYLLIFYKNNLTTIYCDKQADSCRNVA